MSPPSPPLPFPAAARLPAQNMALPVSPAPKSDDVAVQGWSGLTVRIAWTLLARGVKVRPQVLRDARQHVLFHLDPHTPLHHAEDQAAALTAAFVDRAKGRAVADPWPQDMRMPLSPRWRRALDRSLTPLSEAVFRKHYGDNRSLDHLEQRLKVDRVALDVARGGLREVVRRAATADGVPLETWTPERIDRLLVRLAAYAPGPCPPLLDVVEGGYREHVTSCPRCDRTVRLLRSSILTVEDLLPPSLGARPSGTARVLALHLHPDGRHHRRTLREELPGEVFPVGEDLLLVDAADADAVLEVLRTAAEVGTPSRDHLRGAIVEGPGAWTRHGLVGPLVERTEQEVRQRTWSVVDGIGELPPPLPEPPSALPLWFAAAVLGVAASLLLWTALAPDPVEDLGRLSVEFTEGRGGIWTAFDVPEEALVGLVRQEGSGLHVVHAATGAADKVAFAVGDGTFRLHTPGPGVLLVASDHPLDLDALSARAAGATDPLARLGELISEVDPAADWQVHRR